MYVTNAAEQIDSAFWEIYKVKIVEESSEPVILMGYSWGGAAALTLAQRLNKATTVLENIFGIERSIGVDLYFGVEVENDFRGYRGTPKLATTELPSNVKLGVNIYAKDGWPKIEGLDLPGNPQNGLNYLQNALNIELYEVTIAGDNIRMDHHSVIHYNGSLNPRTLAYMEASLSVALYRYR